MAGLGNLFELRVRERKEQLNLTVGGWGSRGMVGKKEGKGELPIEHAMFGMLLIHTDGNVQRNVGLELRVPGLEIGLGTPL